MPYSPQNWERASNFSSTEICWMKPLSRGKTNLGTWKQILIHPAGLFIPHQHGSHSYLASYVPLTTALMTNQNPAQILDAY